MRDKTAELRVLTWNLWWRFGPWQQRQLAIEETLAEENADVIFLQEVWNHPAQAGQAEILATQLGYHWYFAAGTSFEDIELGNAILSRWPLRDTGVVELPAGGVDAERRVVAFTAIDSPLGPIPAFTTHLTWERNNSAGRQAQVAKLMEVIDSQADGGWPPLLAGDFNADPDSDEIRMLTGHSSAASAPLVFQDAWCQGGDSTPGYTWTPESRHYAASRSSSIGAMPRLRRRLDYIFVGLPDGRLQPTVAVQVEKAWLAGKGADEQSEGSDHYAVVADLSPHGRGNA